MISEYVGVYHADGGLVGEARHLVDHSPFACRVVGCFTPIRRETRIQRIRPALQQRVGKLGDRVALVRIDGLAGVRRHDVCCHDALEHGDFRAYLSRHDNVSSKADETVRAVFGQCRLSGDSRESADELAREILEPALCRTGSVVLVDP